MRVHKHAHMQVCSCYMYVEIRGHLADSLFYLLNAGMNFWFCAYQQEPFLPKPSHFSGHYKYFYLDDRVKHLFHAELRLWQKKII